VLRAVAADEEARDRKAVGGFFQATRLPGGLSDESQAIEKNLGIR
jgi:hypothetical protein